MMGHQHGGPLLFAGERLHQRARGGAGLVVERRERLVEQQHRLVAQQGAGKRDALLLAAREGGGALRADVGQADFGEGRGDARRVGFGQAERDVAGGAQVLEQRLGLEQDRDRPLLRRQQRDVAAVDADDARRRREEAGDQVEQRRFAGAALAADGGDRRRPRRSC